MFRKIIHAVSVVFFVVLILVVLYSLASRVMGETPSIFGYYFFHVSSDSMEPTLKVGDVLLVHSVDAEDIHKDDIITYKSKEGSTYGREVTHRVVSDPVISDRIFSSRRALRYRRIIKPGIDRCSVGKIC